MKKSINLKNILEKTREEALEDILKEEIREKLTKEEIYEVYKYVFLVTEKENSISKPINIPVEEISEFIKVIEEVLEKSKELDFNELSIKQYGQSFILFNEGKHLNFNENSVGRYETKAQIDNQQYNYQPSNIEYARQNVYYRQRRVNQMKNIDNQVPKMFLENEQLFLEKAKQRLQEMVLQTEERKKKKLKEEIKFKHKKNGEDEMKNLEIDEEVEGYLLDETEEMDEIMVEELANRAISKIKGNYIEQLEILINTQENEEIKEMDESNIEELEGIAISIILEALNKETSMSIEDREEILQFVDKEELLSNKEFLIKAEKYYEGIVQYAQKEIQNQINTDKNLMTEIILKNTNMIKYASEELKLDEQFILDIINKHYKENYSGKPENSEFWRSLEENLPDEFLLDEEIVLQLIESWIEENYGIIDEDITKLKSFDFITKKMDSKLRNNPEFLKKISDAMGIFFASEEMKSNKEFILETIEKDYWKYAYLKDEFKLDKDVVQTLLDICRQEDEDIFETELEDILEEAKVIFASGNIKKIMSEDNGENKEFIEICKLIEREKIGRLISRTNKIVTHFGDDLDNKAAIHAIQCWAEDNDLIKIGHPIEVIRVPAGNVKEGLLNVDTGGHKGNRLEDISTIVIDGEPENAVKSASAALADLGIYVPNQIVELADTKTNKVSALDSRSGLALTRYLEGEQIFKLAEQRLLHKSLTDEQLEEFGLTKAHEKQQKIIDKALEKIEKYTKTLPNGEKIVLAPETILAGSSIAYEKGINYYASATTHLSNGIPDGVTFAITSKPGIKLPEEVLKFGQELVEKYRIDEDTSGVFVNPNGQMIVAGGFKNPEFRIQEETPEGILQKIESKFIGKEIEQMAEGLEDTYKRLEELEKNSENEYANTIMQYVAQKQQLTQQNQKAQQLYQEYEKQVPKVQE